MSAKFYSTAGKRSKHAPPPSESDSEEERLVTLAAYQTARLCEALTRRCTQTSEMAITLWGTADSPLFAGKIIQGLCKNFACAWPPCI